MDREAISWFAHVHPLTKRKDWKAAKPIDLIQHPGETVFIPGGWWHAVLNLELSIAITHNYASTTNFPQVTLSFTYSEANFHRISSQPVENAIVEMEY